MLLTITAWHLPCTTLVEVSVSGSKTGPWDQVVRAVLESPLEMPDPLPIQKFPFTTHSGRFVKFSLISWYQWGGGLQYFNVKNGKKIFQNLLTDKI